MGPISVRDRRLWAVVLAAALVVGLIVWAVVVFTAPPAGGPATAVSPSAGATTEVPSTTAASTTPAAPATTSVPTATPSGPAERLPSPAPTAPPVSPEPPVTPPPPPPPEPPPAAPFPPALLGQDIEVIPGAGQVVALTFDAGANSAALPSILKTLAQAGVPASFFLTGSWAAANPAGVSAIVASGTGWATTP